MRYLLSVVLAGLAAVLVAGPIAASDVEVKGPHICCPMCVKAVGKLLEKVDQFSGKEASMSPIPLVEAFASIPDPRSRHGRRYPFVPVLCLVTLGLLMGKRTLGSFARLGLDYGPELLLALGFPRGRGPVKSVLSRLLRRINPNALEAALSRWLAPRLNEDADVFSIDGKTLRGSRDGEVPGVHLVAAYAAQAQAVLAQVRVDAKTNEHKAALELLGILPLKGKIVIGDAAFCQRDLAQQVIDQGGDYVMFAKDNQPGLVIDIQAGFAYEAAAAQQTAAFSP